MERHLQAGGGKPGLPGAPVAQQGLLAKGCRGRADQTPGVYGAAHYDQRHGIIKKTISHNALPWPHALADRSMKPIALQVNNLLRCGDFKCYIGMTFPPALQPWQ